MLYNLKTVENAGIENAGGELYNLSTIIAE